MPQVIAPVIGSLTTKYIAGATGSAILGAIGGAVTTGFVAGSLSPNRKLLDFDIDIKSKSQGIQQTNIGQINFHNIIYGERIVGGTLINQNTTKSIKGEVFTGQENEYLHSYIAFCGHEIDSITKYYIDNEEVILDSDNYVYESSNTSFSLDDKYNKSFLWGGITQSSQVFKLYDGSQNELETVKITGVTPYFASPSTLVEYLDIRYMVDPAIVSDPTLDPYTNPLLTSGSELQVRGQTLTLLSDSVYKGNGVYRVQVSPQLPASNDIYSWYNGQSQGVDRYSPFGIIPISSGVQDIKSVGYIEHLTGQSSQNPTYRMAEGSGLGLNLDNLSAYDFANGLGLLYTRFRYHPETFNNFPNVTLKVKGKKCYDPRTTTTIWTENPALIARDYMTSTQGMNIPSSDIDDTYTIASANTCEEQIDIGDGDYQDRYTCNVILSTGDNLYDNLNKILETMYGNVTFVQGKYRIHAGTYQTPSVTIDETYLSENLSLTPFSSRSTLYNSVKGTFVDKDLKYRVSDFLEQSNSNYISDDGEVLTKDLSLNGVVDQKAAQRIAQIHLKKSRFMGQIVLSCNYKALELSAYDNVYLNIDFLGFTNKVFKIINMTFLENGDGISLVLEEDDSTIYDHDEGSLKLSSNLTNYETLQKVGQPENLNLNEILYKTNNSSGIRSKLVVSFDPPKNSNSQTYQVEYKNDKMSEFIISGRTQSNTFDILDLENGVYTVRVRSINPIGGFSDYNSAEIELYGLTAPPSDISGFNINVMNNNAYLSWDIVEDLDVRFGGKIVIKHSKESSPTWSESVMIIPIQDGNTTQVSTPLISGTYLIKAVDTLGNESENAQTLQISIPNIVNLNTVLTAQEDTTFTGTKLDMLVTDGILQLSGTTLFDDLTGFFDDQDGDFDLGGLTGFENEGSYEFNGYLDLEQILECRVSSTIKYTQGDFSSFFDYRQGSFDSQLGQFDGDADNDTLIDFTLYLSKTDDDPSGTPTWSDWEKFYVGDYKARAYKFKIEVSKTSLTANISISELRVSVDVPDRTDAGTITTSASGATTVNFSQSFYTAPNVLSNIINGNQNDYVTITNVTKESFDVTGYNGGTLSSHDVYWIAKGY